jgi:hypothetical protein
MHNRKLRGERVENPVGGWGEGKTRRRFLCSKRKFAASPIHHDEIENATTMKGNIKSGSEIELTHRNESSTSDEEDAFLLFREQKQIRRKQ